MNCGRYIFYYNGLRLPAPPPFWYQKWEDMVEFGDCGASWRRRGQLLSLSKGPPILSLPPPPTPTFSDHKTNWGPGHLAGFIWAAIEIFRLFYWRNPGWTLSTLCQCTEKETQSPSVKHFLGLCKQPTILYKGFLSTSALMSCVPIGVKPSTKCFCH